jgi:hypothetical protein
LHTSLQGIRRLREEESDTNAKFTVSLPPYIPVDVRPFTREEDFELHHQTIVHLPAVDDGQGSSSDTTATTTETICLFLFEVSPPLDGQSSLWNTNHQLQQNSSALFDNLPPWKDPAIQNNSVRQLGPDGFKSFPNHHFFVRVFRHSAVRP